MLERRTKIGPNNFYEVIVVRNADLNSVADVTNGTWAPGMMRHKIHAVAAVVTNAIGAAGVVKVDKLDLATGTRGDGDIAVLNFTTAHTLGKVVYKLCSPPVVMNPGSQAVFEVTDATAAADTATLILQVEVIPEAPPNLTAMVATS